MSVDRDYRIRILTVTEGDPGASARGLQDTGKAAEKAGEDIKLMEFKGRELHEALHKINEIAPGLGTALRAVFNPELLGVTGLILAVETVKGALDSWKKKMDDMAEAGAKADFAAGANALRDAIRDATDAEAEFLRKQTEVLQGEHGITADLANRLGILAAIKAATQERADAEKTLSLAKIQQDEALGRITQSQAIEQKAAIEKAYLNKKSQDDEAQFWREQNERVNANNDALQKKGQLDHAAAEAADKLAKAQKAQADAKSAPSEEDARKARDEADKATAHAEELRRRVTSPLYADITAGSKERAAREAEEDAKAAQAKAADMERLRSQSAAANAIDIKALEDEKKAREDAVQKNNEAIAKTRDEAAKAYNERFNPEVVAARGGGLAAGESAIDVQTRTELARRARELHQEFMQQGPGMTKADATELLRALTDLGGSILQQGKNHVTQQQFQAELQALRRMIESKGK